MTTYRQKKQVYAWALYDWANSAYATAVMAGFFPLFFKEYWSGDMASSESTFWLGLANAAGALLIAMLAPVLGAIADQGGLKRQMLLAFTSLGVVTTAALFLVGQGAWTWALIIYLLGALGFSGANIFYDALIVDVADKHELDRASALGYGLGYIGGGVLFAFDVWMVSRPEIFGLLNSAEAVRWSFISVAIWWAVFTLPMGLWVRERKGRSRISLWAASRNGFRQLLETFHHLRGLKSVWLFLLAYFFYIDGVNTVARMAVDYGLSLGFTSQVLIAALLLTQFIAFPAAIALGWAGDRFGAKPVLLLAILVYALVCIWSSTMQHEQDFYVLAAAIGLVMGGIQSLSRSMYARMIPSEQSAEFFGFFNMLGKFSAVLGPALMGASSMLSGSARISIIVIVLLFALGAVFLCFVRDERV
ncbi:MAG: MFS transporter [Zetaproteobacteria bacterium]|nr:MAG: MFS transporter [Zetaproteobacteria bacterium]